MPQWLSELDDLGYVDSDTYRCALGPGKGYRRTYLNIPLTSHDPTGADMLIQLELIHVDTGCRYAHGSGVDGRRCHVNFLDLTALETSPEGMR